MLVPSDRSVGMFIRRCLVAIDLTYAPEVVALIEKTRDFTRNVVLPIEDEHAGDIAVAGGDAIRIEMQAAAKEAGVFAPHAPIEYGGHGLNMSDRAPVFEEAATRSSARLRSTSLRRTRAMSTCWPTSRTKRRSSSSSRRSRAGTCGRPSP
ncbi:hypothetical protein GCM10020255_110420 [Rhodococcus baikonurensis]